MMNAKQFRELVIRTVLNQMAEDDIPFSGQAEDLLVMIAAHESHLGTYLKQVSGPALGPYQHEPDSLHDLYKNYLRFRFPLEELLSEFTAPGLTPEENLTCNLAYATAVARLQLWRVKEPIPDPEDFPLGRRDETYLMALAVYAKKHWNSALGKATPQDYFTAYVKTL